MKEFALLLQHSKNNKFKDENILRLTFSEAVTEAYRIKSVLGQDEFLGINWENHRKVESDDNKKNMYRVTIETLALEPILKLTEHERVKNVYWHPSYAPPGTGKDAIALRYRLYVEYV